MSELGISKVGATLKGYRRARTGLDGKPLSVRALAEQSGLSHSDISRVERGEKPASARHLLKIARPLQVHPMELLQLGGYIDADWNWIGPDDGEPATLPADPLAAVTRALQAGPWPQNISAAVYCLLSAAQDDKRGLWERRVSDAIWDVVREGHIGRGDELDQHATDAEIVAFALSRVYRNLFQTEGAFWLTGRNARKSTQGPDAVLR